MRINNFAIIFSLFLLSIGNLSAQNSKIDSLKKVSNNQNNHDTVKMKAIFLIAQAYLDSKPDTAIFYSDILIDYSKKKGNKRLLANAYHTKSWAYVRKGENDKAFPLLSDAIKLFEELNDQTGLANSYNAIGGIFSMQKDSVKGAEYRFKALAIYEKINDKKGMASVYSNLASGTPSQNTMKYIQKSYQLFEELGDKKGMATALFKIAQFKLILTKSKEIPEEFFQCLKTFEELNNMVWVSYMHSAIGEMYYERKEFKKAYDHSMKGYKLALSHDLSKEKMDNLRILVEACSMLGKYEEALNYYQKMILERDSVNNIEVNNSIIKQEMASVYEKQKVIEKKEQEKQLAIAAEKEEKQKLLSYLIGLVLLLVIIFSVVISGKLRLTKKQKLIIEEQSRNTEKQKEIIEEKQKEIIDSINYAKRLQEAILPTEEFIQMHLPDSFIFFKPKDIVAGDFYWLESVSSLHLGSDLIFIAAADCTGHGVPGAIVSMICHNALNRALLEYQITDPGKILNITRELVISTFEKGDTDVKDGMDISLCCINKKTNELSWAGANNPLWIIPNNSNEIKKLSPDKQPIGKMDHAKPFNTTKIQLMQGDTIYLFTDGFADQFGGPKGKKFKYKQMEELLLSICGKPLSEQSKRLEEEFEGWKGKLAQVDDVCVIGIRI